MDIKQVHTVVIGAGVVGLACARAVAMAGHEVLILEAAKIIGSGISSRNSEVIHAGIYYPKHSLKAELCVQGNRLLQNYAAKNGVPHKMTGKLIVATTPEEEATLGSIREKAEANGVQDLKLLSAAEAHALEPELKCSAALLSPSTGIIDTHSLMLALLGEAEANGALLALQTKVLQGEQTDLGVLLKIEDEEPFYVLAQNVIVAAGLSAPAISRSLGLKNIPQEHLCKGNYFSLTGPAPFSRLVYPVPVAGGLGTHYTLDLGGRGRFGPDVEWIEEENYDVDETRREGFAQAVRRYWPACRANMLEPSYSGIRPKIGEKGAKEQDFLILQENNIVALLGIESPGLTSCLAIADKVAGMLNR